MFGLKKKGRAASLKLHDTLVKKLRPQIEKISGWLRLAPRLRLFSRWSRKNPKKLTIYYLGFALTLISVNMITSMFYSTPDPDPLGLSHIADNNLLGGMQTISMNRELIKEAGSEYNKAYLKVAQRLDSLCGLKEKSMADSIEIDHLWKLLNIKPSNNTNIP